MSMTTPLVVVADTRSVGAVNPPVRDGPQEAYHRPMVDELPEVPRWQGINHLALVTPDMDTTVRFYVGVLGMRLVATTMAGPMRHYFFEMDRGNTVAFFEVEGAETFAKPAGGPSDRAIQLDHISFDVPDEHALEMLRKRLLAAGSEVTEVVDHGFIRSVYFTDPNGIALEASWWVVDGTGRPTDPTDPALFGDPDPVPAVAELRAGGLRDLPQTRLT
jgi:catechol 2,3-dioxygenase-like lactoylglutathione lyase family enzyme